MRHPFFKSQALFLVLLGLTALPAMSAESAPASPARQGLTVNGQAIPADRIDQLALERVPQGETVTAAIRKKTEDDLVIGALLSQEATRLGLDRAPNVANELYYAREGVLAHAYIEHQLKSIAVSDQEARSEYNRLKAQMGDKEYKIAHILVKTEKEANDLIKKLKHGASFNKLAKQYSLDKGTQANGGELNWVNPHMLVDPIAKVVSSLAKGKFTETPVHSQFGYHVVRLEDVRPVRIPAFEMVKPRLVRNLQQVALQRQIAQLRARAKVSGDTP